MQEKNEKFSHSFNFAFKIKQLRKELSLNQSDFAESIGLKRDNIAQIEIGKSNITLEMIFRIVKKLTLNMNIFLRII